MYGQTRFYYDGTSTLSTSSYFNAWTTENAPRITTLTLSCSEAVNGIYTITCRYTGSLFTTNPAVHTFKYDSLTANTKVDYVYIEDSNGQWNDYNRKVSIKVYPGDSCVVGAMDFTYMASFIQPVYIVTSPYTPYAYKKLATEDTLTSKVDKVDGRGLSECNFTYNEKVTLSDVPRYINIVNSNTAARHTHSNKTLLDTYTQTNVDITNAITNTHTHTNKEILDSTTASFTDEDKLKLESLSNLIVDDDLDESSTNPVQNKAVYQAWYNLSDSVSFMTSWFRTNASDILANTDARHTHTNKNVLDATTVPFTEEDKLKLDSIDDTGTKIVVDTTTTDLTCPCENGTEYRYGALQSLIIPTLTATIEQEYITSIVFLSDAGATTFTDNASIKFTGDNCENNVFTPMTNVRYELVIWWNGFNFQGIVRGDYFE